MRDRRRDVVELKVERARTIGPRGIAEDILLRAGGDVLG
jgi:hypothetical protein